MNDAKHLEELARAEEQEGEQRHLALVAKVRQQAWDLVDSKMLDDPAEALRIYIALWKARPDHEKALDSKMCLQMQEAVLRSALDPKPKEGK